MTNDDKNRRKIDPENISDNTEGTPEVAAYDSGNIRQKLTHQESSRKSTVKSVNHSMRMKRLGRITCIPSRITMPCRMSAGPGSGDPLSIHQVQRSVSEAI